MLTIISLTEIKYAYSMSLWRHACFWYIVCNASNQMIWRYQGCTNTFSYNVTGFHTKLFLDCFFICQQFPRKKSFLLITL